MGITSIDVGNLKVLVEKYKPKSVLELGSQYLYDSAKHCQAAVEGKPVYGKSWFESHGIKHTSVDINDEADINLDITDNDHNDVYDWVTDYGTIEHTNSAFDSFRNCHNWVKIGGLMIHENPKAGNWPDHGNWFFTQEFYRNLAAKCKYEIIDLKEIAAMGNTKSGWNVYCVLGRTAKSVFDIEEDDFYKGIYDE